MRVKLWCVLAKDTVVSKTRNIPVNRSYPISVCFALVLMSFGHAFAGGQKASATARVCSFATFPVPVVTGELERSDPAAIAELAKHLVAVGAEPWTGMQGTGTITFGPANSKTYAATLSNVGDGEFRLDTDTSKGSASIRIYKGLGKTQDPDGSTYAVPPDVALAGIFPFEFMRMVNLAKGISLIDHDICAIGSSKLHRISVEIPSLGKNPFTKSQNTVAIDFYFDPSTHLLVNTVNSLTFAEAPRTSLLAVVTYEDFRQVNGVLIPFRFTETLEGQQSRSLQLSDVRLGSGLTIDYFKF